MRPTRHPALLLSSKPPLPTSSSRLLPSHDTTTTGVLPNGFTYVILPNSSPAQRFEAHLQVFTGSANELHHQQGIAHLTEHVAYMGSQKRERLFGTGSQTNAYTDFHHTVFYASCPVDIPGGGGYSNSVFSGGSSGKDGMMPLALDALREVMDAKVETGRLEKERQAVLSEMTMVNTIEYRVECQILSTLHRENRLAKRFPIGKESLIRTWTTDDVKEFHRTHYRPDNVLLYIVGDVDVEKTKRVIEDKFGSMEGGKYEKDIGVGEKRDKAITMAKEVKDTVKSSQSWHFPPVVHQWGESSTDSPLPPPTPNDLQLQDDYDMDDKTLNTLPDHPTPSGSSIRPHIFRHELLRSFSLHLFAKRTVKPIVTVDDFKQSLARRIVLAALQIRLNVNARGDDTPFTFVEFNQLDSPREGCAVCSLDLMAESHRWREAVVMSVGEIRRLGKFGLTEGEMMRYAGALLSDSQQVAAQGDRISHSDQLSYLMETVACGHALMSPSQSYIMTEEALAEMTLSDVNAAATELCEHVLSLGDKEGVTIDGPVIAVACGTKDEGMEGDVPCNEKNLIEAILEAGNLEVEPEEDIVVPRTLVEEDELKGFMADQNPTWEGGRFTDGTPATSPDQITTPLTLRRLSNGIRVGITSTDTESQRGHLRIVAPGGRVAEERLGFKSGSMAVGSRTMQEGGAFAKWTREQVELFCVDHLIMVEINCSEEFLTMDFVFPTTEVGNVGFGKDVQVGITGTEAVMQIVREILSGFQWEEDALGRAKQHFYSSYDSLYKSLEGLSTEKVMLEMTGGDKRFTSVDHDDIDAVGISDARQAVMSQLIPGEIEMSVVGDFDVKYCLDMILKYVGTIPEGTNLEYLESAPKFKEFVALMDKDGDRVEVAMPPAYSVPEVKGLGGSISITLEDPDPRAVAYVSGEGPNKWGYLRDGRNIADLIVEKEGNKQTKFDLQRRRHPLFAHVGLMLIGEIVNRRLFSNVREKKQLTYDANFRFTGFDNIAGGYWLCTVTASKEKADLAAEACVETLVSLGRGGIGSDNLESARRVVGNRHEGEMRSTRYVAEMMSGLQLEGVGKKGPLGLTDFQAMASAITVEDLRLIVGEIGFTEDRFVKAVGKTVKPEGYMEPDDGDQIVRAAPGAGSRGGPLM
eukprot:CAMPEP_0118655944 /NCGR_PEP_ID=MMETSP0785-20121206/13220_1 /TAXON_ID=91992 /ORGANISM="Bolidomonas pacifica, Strain CCMP 1866" /LENGTH=1144 /DNA_ID=CAMNT_0006548759 /DNA_START=480 /DNA_END=3912 /DNA_ORIENTATION=-